MCGIVGYVGKHTATPILLDGLSALEYRGYDSAGIFVPGIGMRKAVGPVSNLRARVDVAQGSSSGIAHTRWATHGAPTEVNAHPHCGHGKRVYIVHNGIIENYRDIKDTLVERGSTFASETDTEVLAHLIESYFAMGVSLDEAVREALTIARGTYGIAVMSAEDPGTLVVARMGSPIVLGVAEHGHLIASDPSALMEHTKDVVYLEDGEMAVLTQASYSISTIGREARDRAPEKIEWDVEAAQKNGHEHFMLKEIMEGPEVLRNTMLGRLIPDLGRAKLGGIEDVREKLAALSRLTIVGCGSAYYAGMVGKYMLEKYAKLPVDVDVASEYRYRSIIADPSSAVLAVTQSGETADTRASIQEAKRLGLMTLGIVNTVGSTIARETDAGVYNHAGPEIGVASTKAVLSQITVFILLTLFLGRDRTMSLETGKEIVRALTLLPDQVADILSRRDELKRIAEKYAWADDFIFIGRGHHVPMAYEGALKLKEVSYIHAEGYGAGEMKHGPMAMISETFPTVAIVPQDELYEKTLSNIEEIKARGGPVIAIATEGDTRIAEIVDDVFYIPRHEHPAHDITTPILTTVPLQLFAYYMGTGKGYNVDRPRNLAKSVTVE